MSRVGLCASVMLIYGMLMSMIAPEFVQAARGRTSAPFQP
jgi:hypothetical protein